MLCHSYTIVIVIVVTRYYTLFPMHDFLRWRGGGSITQRGSASLISMPFAVGSEGSSYVALSDMMQQAV